MNVFEAIEARRSIGKVRSDRPERAQIEKLLEMAILAPNHHLTQPWRFFVVAGTARQELGAIMRANLAERLPETESEKAIAALEKEQHKPLRAPVLIVVACKHNQESKATEMEDIEATSAATQNMLLAAQELGLATVWRTGEAAYSHTVKAWLKLDPKDHIIGIIYLGYAAIPVSEREIRTYEDKTEWLGWSD